MATYRWRKEYAAEFSAWYGRSIPLEPISTSTVQEWNKQYLLQTRVQWILAQRALPMHLALDCDAQDGKPQHFKYGRLIGVKPEHLDVMWGLIWPLLEPAPDDVLPDNEEGDGPQSNAELAESDAGDHAGNI
jgi:hypothetical protein